MTTTTHAFLQTVPCGDQGAEIELRITYTFTPGAPEQGPTYSSGGQPADPDEIEFVSCIQVVDGRDRIPYGAFRDLEQTSHDAIAESWLQDDIGRAQAIENALDERQGDADAAAEARAEQRREDR